MVHMIKKLRLKFGTSSSQVPLEFAPGSATIFVGPNNSGKSLVLLEIGMALSASNEQRRIVADVDAPHEEWLKLRPYFEKVDGRGTAYVGSLLLASANPSLSIDGAALIKSVENQQPGALERARIMVRSSQVANLNGRERLRLIEPRSSGDLNQVPSNHLQALYRDDAKRTRLANMTKDAFGLYFVIDPTNMAQQQVAMTAESPTPDLERSTSNEAIEFFKRATPIGLLSDGVQAYCGILAAALSADLRLILIDEPDAFLHPPLARKLGKTLTTIASERAGNVLASTHSVHFLMGSIQSGKSVNVVRLTYQEKVPSARILDSTRLKKLMCDPLIRSARVLDALFHKGAVVCESDKDRAFYQEINERLMDSGRHAAEDCIFLQAQNKQTIGRIVRPLREMGVPAAALVDLDIIQSSKNHDLRNLMEATFIPDGLRYGYGQTRGQLEASFSKKDLKPKRVGISALEKTDRETAEGLRANLAEYGIFVVPVGELELWLPGLGVPSEAGDQKRDWLLNVFAKMGSDPDGSDYVKPGCDDVWAFLEQIAGWIANPNRKGMPD